MQQGDIQLHHLQRVSLSQLDEVAHHEEGKEVLQELTDPFTALDCFEPFNHLKAVVDIDFGNELSCHQELLESDVAVVTCQFKKVPNVLKRAEVPAYILAEVAKLKHVFQGSVF